jgi:hypothetical protein
MTFAEIADVELYGFNEQNVLFDLKITRASDGLFDVKLESSYGFGGNFRCASIGAASA